MEPEILKEILKALQSMGDTLSWISFFLIIITISQCS